MKRNNKTIFFSTLTFILGFLTNLLISKSSGQIYSIETKINIFDIINLIITSSIAIIIGWYITEKVTETRYEKEYIIDEIFSLSKQCKKIELLINSNKKLDLSKLIPVLTDLQLKIEQLTNTIEIFNLNKNSLGNIKNERSELHIALTNTDETIITLDSLKKHELKKILNNLDCDIKKLIYNINKS